MTEIRVLIKDEAHHAIDTLAVTMGTTSDEVIKRAVACLLLIEGHRAAGDRLLVERPDGERQEIQPTWWTAGGD